jgi:hypothetical protein
VTLLSGVGEEVYRKRLWRKGQCKDRSTATQPVDTKYSEGMESAEVGEARYLVPRRCSTYRGSTETFVVCSPREISVQNVWCFVNDEPQSGIGLEEGWLKAPRKIRKGGRAMLRTTLSGASSVDNNATIVSRRF